VALIPLTAMLPRLPAAMLTADGVTHTRQGRRLGPVDLASTSAAPDGTEWVRLLAPDGALAALGRLTREDGRSAGVLHPSVVLI